MTRSAHDSRRATRSVWLAVASGALLTLSYAPFDWPLVAWVAWTPLLVALDGAPLRRAVALGWLSGTIGGLGITGYWIDRAAADYFGLSALGAALFTFGVVQVFVAPFYGLFAALANGLGASRVRLLLIPAALVLCEAARSQLTGNAWALLGHAVGPLPIVQIVDVTGVAGLSFLLALSAAIAADLCRDLLGRVGWRTVLLRRAGELLFGTAVVGAVVAYGDWRLDHLPPASATLRVLLVQGAIDNAARSAANAAEAIRRYVGLTEAAPPAPLVVWPENAIAVFPEQNDALLTPVHVLVAERGTTLLAGAPRAGDRAGRAALFNSLYAFNAAGSWPVYDKRRLLPFVERFPLRSQDGPYVPGEAPVPFVLGAAHAGLLICYEVIDAGLARAAVADGANLLVNASNDSWFAAGAGPEQHFAIARFRAIENRVALLRATDSGISGAFDPSGDELARLPADTPTAQIVDVPLVNGGSFYTRHGDWLVLVCAVTVGLGAIAQLARQLSRRRR